MGIIKSLLDNDLYTFTVQYFLLEKYDRAMGVYEFKDRNNTKYPIGFADKLRNEIDSMALLKITEDEVKFMKEKIDYLPKWYVETFLKGYSFDPSEVSVEQDKEGHLSIKIEGYWWKTVMWEVPLLAMVSELYHKELGENPDMVEFTENARDKYRKLVKNGLNFSDFGTRRRFSYATQQNLITGFLVEKDFLYSDLNAKGKFVGTSNVHFAHKFGLTPIGTMSHQIISGIGALYGYKEANYIAMDNWQEVYDGDLGIFLYDTYGWDSFNKNFSKRNAMLFKGLRVDSGDNIDQFNKIIDKYKSLKIDPKTKDIIFSNGLNVDEAISIHKKIDGDMNDSYGIGTYFTCDLPNIKPSNIVIKLSKVKITENTEWSDAVKLSNDEGKYTGCEEEVDLALRTLRHK